MHPRVAAESEGVGPTLEVCKTVMSGEIGVDDETKLVKGYNAATLFKAVVVDNPKLKTGKVQG